MTKIYYVCECCDEHAPEAAGHSDRTGLRVMPNGQWLCDSCYYDMETPEITGIYGVEPMSYDADGDVDEWPIWSGFDVPPEYVPLEVRK